MPSEKRNKNVKGKGGRKGEPSGESPSAPVRKKGLPFPLLIAWVLAVVILSSLLYYSRHPGQQSLKIQSSGFDRRTMNGPLPDPGTDLSGTETQPPARPRSPAKPDQAAPEAGKGAQKTPSRSSAPVQPGKESVAVAANKPAPGGPPAPAPDIRPKAVARVAIIIDDIGPDIDMAKKFLALPFPVTLSILPYQAHSKDIAELAHNQGRQIMLHCPMEPISYPKENPGKGALLASMARDEIRRGIGTALDASPYFAGVNNHMGSRLTQDLEAMRIVMSVLKDHNLFFVDSMTSADSKAFIAARELKIPAGKRDIFLDNDPSPEGVRAQIARLIKISKVQGTALAIGHPHEATLISLQDAGGQFRKEGIDIVPAGDLMSSR